MDSERPKRRGGVRLAGKRKDKRCTSKRDLKPVVCVYGMPCTTFSLLEEAFVVFEKSIKLPLSEKGIRSLSKSSNETM